MSLFVLAIYNTNGITKNNGFWLTLYEWYKTLEKRHTVFFYNIFNPQLKLHDSDWVQPNLDIKYMTDINDFIKFSGKKIYIL